MLRALWYLVLLAGLAWAAVWLADHPGGVTVVWFGYEITAPVWLALVAVAMAAAGSALLYTAWRWLRLGPRRIVARREARRREQGYESLTRGLVAIAAGDAKAALRCGREAGRLLENPLNLLVLAQAARLDGDEAAARRQFGAMLEHPETEFLGLRGLLVEATKSGDWQAALGYARRAYALRPETEWVSGALFDLEVRGGEWRAAQRTLEAAERHKHVGAGDVPRRRAVLLAERAREAHAHGRDEEALRIAREAHKLAPGLVAPAVLAAGLLCAAGKPQAAGKLIGECWSRAPHPDLARAWAALAPDETAMQRVKRFERLRDRSPDHPESAIALAEAALEAELWGKARSGLEAAARERPTQRVYRLLAAVEEREGGESDAVRFWLLRAASAPPDAAWLCRKCGAVAAEWGARCGGCGAFDSLEWKVPPGPAAPAPTVSAQPAEPAPGGDERPAAPAVIVDAAVARK